MKIQSFLFRPAFLLAGLFSLLAGPRPAAAQNDGGDQFLDGIGETSLVARYRLDGNTVFMRVASKSKFLSVLTRPPPQRRRQARQESQTRQRP